MDATTTRLLEEWRLRAAREWARRWTAAIDYMLWAGLAVVAVPLALQGASSKTLGLMVGVVAVASLVVALYFNRVGNRVPKQAFQWFKSDAGKSVARAVDSIDAIKRHPINDASWFPRPDINFTEMALKLYGDAERIESAREFASRRAIPEPVRLAADCERLAVHADLLANYKTSLDHLYADGLAAGVRKSKELPPTVSARTFYDDTAKLATAFAH